MYGTLDRAKTFSSCLREFLSKQIRIVRFLSLFPGIYVIMLCNISVLLLTAFGRLLTAVNAVCDGSRLCDEPRSFSRPFRSVLGMQWGFALACSVLWTTGQSVFVGAIKRVLHPDFTRDRADLTGIRRKADHPQNARILSPAAGAASGIVRWMKLHTGGTHHETQTSR